MHHRGGDRGRPRSSFGSRICVCVCRHGLCRTRGAPPKFDPGLSGSMPTSPGAAQSSPGGTFVGARPLSVLGPKSCCLTVDGVPVTPTFFCRGSRAGPPPPSRASTRNSYLVACMTAFWGAMSEAGQEEEGKRRNEKKGKTEENTTGGKKPNFFSCVRCAVDPAAFPWSKK